MIFHNRNTNNICIKVIVVMRCLKEGDLVQLIQRGKLLENIHAFSLMDLMSAFSLEAHICWWLYASDNYVS